MFPKNWKKHIMELRNPEVFNVDHANTERFRKSAIINMQHLLNEDAENFKFKIGSANQQSAVKFYTCKVVLSQFISVCIISLSINPLSLSVLTLLATRVDIIGFHLYIWAKMFNVQSVIIRQLKKVTL